MKSVLICFVIIMFLAVSAWTAPPNPKLFEKFSSSGKTMMSIADINKMAMLDPDVPRMNYIKQADGIEYVLTIRVDFSDQPGKKPASALNDDIFGKKDTSMYLYFNEVSYGQMQIQPGYLGGVIPKDDSWYRMSKKMSYYGAGAGYIMEDRYRELVKEACNMADSDVDFSQYDRDNDGYIDHLIIIHSGNDEASTGVSNDMWSVMLDAIAGVYDGKKIASAVIVSENPSDSHVNIGIYCHEFFHDFGAPDFYNSYEYPVGLWCLMGVFGPYLDNGQHPSHISSYLKWDFDANRSNGIRGWLEPIELKDNGEYSINALESPSDKQLYKIDIPGKDGKEYFLIENRNNKLETIYDTYLPDSGILIWHIDENQMKDLKYSSYPYRIYIEDPEDPDRTSRNKATQGAAFSAEDKQTEFTLSTYPNSNANDDSYSGIIVTDISQSGANMTFSLFMGDTYEPNNDVLSAFPIKLGKKYVSFIKDKEDVDFYSFDVFSNTINIIYLENIPRGNDYELSVLDAQGKVISTMNEPSQSTKRLSFKANKDGIYYVEVFSENGYSPNQPYFLTVDSTSADLAPGMISILKIYPNPGPDPKGRINFEYKLIVPVDNIMLEIYTINGTLVHTHSIDTLSRNNELYWDVGSDIANGVYIYVLKTEFSGKTETKIGKIAVLK
jgi:immune inhibitor A